MKSARIIQLVTLLAATAFLHSHLAQAQVRAGGPVPAGSPPVSAPPAGIQPAGAPQAGTPPTGIPPAGAPPMGIPPAGTPAPGGIGTPPDLGTPPTLNTPNNAAPRMMTNGSFTRRFGTNGFNRRGRDGDGDADDMRRFQPYRADRWRNRNGTNGAPVRGATAVTGGATNALPATPQGVPSAPR
jgi:hypothetical protein